MTLKTLAAAMAAALCAIGSPAASAADAPAEGRHARHGHQVHHVHERRHGRLSSYAEVHYDSPRPFYRGYSGQLPSCADPGVHADIASSFAGREREYWGSSLELSSFTRPTEIGYRSWGPEFVPRRFCSASAYTSDGRKRQVYWLVAERQGFASVGTGVEWCVTGLDRSYAFAPGCKMARP